MFPLIQKKSFLGLRVDNFSKKNMMLTLDRCIQDRRPTAVLGLSVTMAMKLRSMPEIQDMLEKADIVTIDGKGVEIFSAILGDPIKEHFSLPDMCDELLALANQKRYRVFLLGATKEVNRVAREAVKRQFPNVDCIGRDGYFSQQEEEGVAKAIKEYSPDILLVGISTPKKENFIFGWKNMMGVPICVACGGYIDVLSGKARREPKLMKKFALAWLFRFVQEPVRLFDALFVNVFLFVGYVLPIALWKKYFKKEKVTLVNIIS